MTPVPQLGSSTIINQKLKELLLRLIISIYELLRLIGLPEMKIYSEKSSCILAIRSESISEVNFSRRRSTIIGKQNGEG